MVLGGLITCQLNRVPSGPRVLRRDTRGPLGTRFNVSALERA